MRFSLGTLLLFVVWFALGMTVRINRAPWTLRNSEMLQQESFSRQPVFAPDGTRALNASAWGGPLIVLDALPGVTPDEMMCLAYEKNFLYEFKEYDWPHNFKFINNDTIEFECLKPPVTTNEGPRIRVTFERRFPEWWWGHFYRVEVWLFTLASGLLLYRAYRSVKARRRSTIGSTEAAALVANC